MEYQATLGRAGWRPGLGKAEIHDDEKAAQTGHHQHRYFGLREDGIFMLTILNCSGELFLQEHVHFRVIGWRAIEEMIVLSL